MAEQKEALFKNILVRRISEHYHPGLYSLKINLCIKERDIGMPCSSKFRS